MAHRAPRPDADREHHHGQPELPAGEQRELGKTLGDADVERVHRAERAADARGAQAHRHRREAVEADAARQRHEHRHHGDDFLPHALGGAAGAERRTGHRDDEHFPPSQPGGHPADAAAQRAGLVHDADGRTGHEHHGQHAGRVDEALRHRDERVERADRALRDVVKRARHHDLAVDGGVVAPLELPGGDDVGERGGNQHARQQQGEGVSHQGVAVQYLPGF